MATKTWYINEITYDGTDYLFLDPDESNVPVGINRSSTGWEPGRKGVGDAAWMDNGDEVNDGDFASVVGDPDFTSSNIDEPASTPTEFANIAGSVGLAVPRTAVIFTVPFNAIIEGGNAWTLTLDVAANSRAWPGSGEGRLILRAYKISFELSGGTAVANTTEIELDGVTGFTTGTTVTGLSTNLDNKQTTTVTYTPTGVDPNSGWRYGYWETYVGRRTETSSRSGYLALALGWEVVTAIGGSGANNRCDVNILYGTGTNSKLVSAPFRKKVYAAT